MKIIGSFGNQAENACIKLTSSIFQLSAIKQATPMLKVTLFVKAVSQASLLGAFILLASTSPSVATPLSLSSTATLARSANFPSNQQIYSAYFNAGYGYCDAQMLGAFWGKNPGDSKFLAGKALLRLPGFAMDIPNKLVEARRTYSGQGVCNFSSDFSYKDAFALAAYWNVPIAQAKSSLTNKLEAGALQLARGEVRKARQSTTSFKNLDLSGDVLGYYVKKIDGSWVEKNAAGEDTFSFREVRRNRIETVLVDDSRGVEIKLNRSRKTIYYRELNSNVRARPLYAIQP